MDADRTVTISEPGLSTTVQDRGRLGYYEFGIPQGGSLDQYSAELANALVGNSGGEALLECTYNGPVLVVGADVNIAVTGAPVEVRINGASAPNWSRVGLKPGDEVSFGFIAAGSRFYIAFSGGIDVPVVLGSRSTYPLGVMGGFQGRKLEAGDVVPLGAPQVAPVVDSVAEDFRPSFERQQSVRVMLGLYDHRLTKQGLAALTG